MGKTFQIAWRQVREELLSAMADKVRESGTEMSVTDWSVVTMICEALGVSFDGIIDRFSQDTADGTV